MKNIIKSTLLLCCSICLLAACDDDRDSNPVLQKPTRFVLNTPALAANATYDLANSSSILFTCSQPDYGFPIATIYKMQIATKEDMSDATELSASYTNTRMNVDAAEMASTLTNMELAAGKTEADFPMNNLAVYVRARAYVVNTNGDAIEGTEILSNVVKLNSVRLLFSLPPVTTPDDIYIVGSFNNWDWNSCLQMAPVYGSPNKFWHLVYIDGTGIKFNTAKAWDGGQVDYTKLHSVGGELADQIKDGGGNDHNITSSNPGWYLMIITTSVAGRDIVYDVEFNKPNVYLIGPVSPSGTWTEGEESALFSVPATPDGQFVSPAFSASGPGGDSDGIRAYVLIDAGNWWHSEFMVFENKIKYRGTGGDQARIEGAKGQKLYLNFTKDTGEIK